MNTSQSPYNLEKLKKARVAKRVRICDIARALNVSDNTIGKTLGGKRANETVVLAIGAYLGLSRDDVVRKNGKRKTSSAS